jgi:NAD(P)-dependent dehydrogenase (short-subunit alcohol dehydrogenase family)
MLQAKVVVVVGAAGTLGREFCAAIVRQGGTVVVADKDTVAAHKLAKRLCAESASGRAAAAYIDITRAGSIDRLLRRFARQHGRVDAVVNCAYPRNPSYGKDAMTVTYAEFCGNLNIHLGGYFLVTQRFARFFLKQGHGNIVNLASIYGLIAPRFELYAGTRLGMPVEYAAIKAGLIHLTRYFSKLLSGANIRVNAISPGGILDGQERKFIARYRKFCLNKGMLEAQDLTGALLFLLSDASRFVNGHNLVVDDGFTL